MRQEPLARGSLSAANLGYPVLPHQRRRLRNRALFDLAIDSKLRGACGMVESAGYVTREATNATCALSILAVNSSIAILCTDIDMPGPIGGMALAFETKARLQNIGIIITSGRWPLARHEIRLTPCSLKSPTLNGLSSRR